MRDDQRGYASGIGWAVLTVAAVSTMGQPPGAAPTASALDGFLVGHQSQVVVASTLSAVSGLLLLPFAASLTARFSDAWPARVTRTAMTVLVSVVVLGGVLQACLAQAAPHLDASARSAAWVLVQGVFYVAPPFALSLSLGTAYFALRGTSVPRAVGVAAGVLAAYTFLVSVATLVATDSAAVDSAGFVGLLLSVAWVLVASVSMWRTAPDVDVSAPRVAAGSR